MSTSNLIVLELLSSTFDNYEDWKVTMQSYLKGEGLWGIIQENETDGMTQEMNAKALHAIQISCAPEILSLIKEIESAKEAWEFLEKEYNMNWEYINTYIETQNKLKEQEDVGKHIYLHTSLYIAALNGDWESAKQVLDRDRDAVHAPLNKNKNTVLHIAVSTASTKFVRNLITNYMSKEDLKQKNFYGCTALHFAAAWGRLDMVKLLLDNNPGLLPIRSDDSSTALTEAIRDNHKHVSSFLYYESATHQTPPPEDGIHLIYSIVAGNYGIHVGSRSISGNEADEQHNGSPQGIYLVIMTRVLQSVEQLLLKIPQVLGNDNYVCLLCYITCYF
uniref:DUF4219 domain-containing protein n=1 Tax=Nelumbo nucifera TaxID=4432 RepID=A0A822Z8J0_NELNU|nr:TPA_asm: hypothetical protein HUJ06_013699 [Nelumbo nucifera]